MSEHIVRRIIRSGGEVEVLNEQTSMGTLRQLIGAKSCDTVNLSTGMVMIVDDEGHAKGLPKNDLATALYLKKCLPGTTHYIVGDVAIVPDSDFGGFF